MNCKRKSNLLNGTIALCVSTLIIKVIGVLYKIPLSYLLGEEGMGYFNSAYAVYGFFYIISSAGIPKAIAVKIAKLENASEAYLRSVCKKLIHTFSIFAASVTLLFFILSAPISSLVGSSRSMATLIAIGPSIFCVTLSGVLRGFMNGKSDLMPIAVSQLIEAVSKLGLGILMALVGIKLTLPLPMISAVSILGITFGSIFSLVYMYFSAFRGSVETENIPQARHEEKSMLQEIIKYALPITLSAALGSASGIVDLFIIINGLKDAGFSEVDATAAYGNYSTLALPMINLVTSLLLPITVALLPTLAKFNAKDRDFSYALDKAWSITLAFSLPAAIIYAFYSFDILDILFASHASSNGAQSLSILSASAVLLPLLTVINTALEASGKMGNALFSLTVGIILKIIASTFMIYILDLGIIGTAIGTVASHGLSLAVSMLFLYKCGGRVQIGKSLITMMAALLLYLPPYVLIYAVNIFKNQQLSFIVSVLSPSIIYLLLIIRLLFPHFSSNTKEHNAQKKEHLKKSES